MEITLEWIHKLSYIWCQAQLFRSNPLDTVLVSTLDTMNDQKEQQMWNMQLQIRLQELSRRAAHNLGRHLKMEQVTIIFTCQLSRLIFHSTNRRPLLSPTRRTSGRWGSCWSRSRSWAPSWPTSAASWTPRGAWCGCRRGTGRGCGSWSGSARSTATPAAGGSAQSTRATRRAAARVRGGQSRNSPGGFKLLFYGWGAYNLFIM